MHLDVSFILHCLLFAAVAIVIRSLRQWGIDVRRILIGVVISICIAFPSHADDPTKGCQLTEAALWGAGGLVIGLLLFPPAGALVAVLAAGGGKCWYDEKTK